MIEERSKIMDDLIAQDADLIDNPLIAAVRELLTDDSQVDLGAFINDLVEAIDRHGLQVVSKIYIDWQNDTIRECKDEIKGLREAGNDLGGYAGHDDSCDCVKGWAKGPCNCGYTYTWNQWNAALGEQQ